MQETRNTGGREIPVVRKAPTGIKGLDEVTYGGLPSGRTTLVCGGAGCGKSLLALEFLIRGALDYGETGVFMTFEETPEEVAENVGSLGFDLNRLVEEKKLNLDHVYIDRTEIRESGEYDLEGLFIRLGYAIDSIQAKRVALDTIEHLFGGFSNEAILRAELKRLFQWLKSRGVTAVVTGERGVQTLTRHGLEEYVSDCVILLDHRVQEQVSTRRLRVVKYRGSMHGTNEYPFLIDEKGISVMPITSAQLNHNVSEERLSSGIPRLDAMLRGNGFYRGSSILVSGTPGTGKTSFAATMANASCERGERTLYFSFEESPQQIMRNMRTIGLDLQQWTEKGLLRFQTARPTHYGLEMHLAVMQKLVDEIDPKLVVLDPLNNLVAVGSGLEVTSMLTRLIDYLKGRGITTYFTGLIGGGEALEATNVGISSLMDTWLLLRDIESNGERNRGLHILKSRGMAHSNQIREFLITDQGIRLLDVYTGQEGVVTGAARAAQESRARAAIVEREEELARRKAVLEMRRKVIEAQRAALEAELESEEMEFNKVYDAHRKQLAQSQADQEKMAQLRRADERGNGAG